MPRYALGLDGGGTSTKIALLVDDTVVLRQAYPAANLALIQTDDLQRLWQKIAADFPASPDAIGAFVAGCNSSARQNQLRSSLAQTWPGAEITVGSDLQAAHAGAFDDQDGILLVVGTGSGLLARLADQQLQLGGRGHIGGDTGSAYWLGARLLEYAFLEHDLEQAGGPIASRLLAHLCLNAIEDLATWSAQATKAEIASLAPLALATPSIPRERGAAYLAELVHAASQRIEQAAPAVAITGGLVQAKVSYYKQIADAIQAKVPQARIVQPVHDAAVGAALLAGQRCQHTQTTEPPVRRGLNNSPTEARNPRSHHLEQRSISELVELMTREDAYVHTALQKAQPHIVAALELLVPRYQAGGRLFYIGAGTSGRLGVLDASECPPTFNTPADRVQGIIAGGAPALHRSVESQEDSETAGITAMQQRGVSAADTVVGIAASGSTPFVLSALCEAHQIGAAAILITCNPHADFALPSPFVRIDLETGPEILTGSTRLKAGTATKLVLNQLTTITMIQSGKVIDNLMVDVKPSCQKLRLRLVSILHALTGLPPDVCQQRLAGHAWSIRRVLDDQALQ